MGSETLIFGYSRASFYQVFQGGNLMARLPRLYLPGCAQHVIQRGNNREACFYAEADYKAYLSFLKDAAAKYQVAIHAFGSMGSETFIFSNKRASFYQVFQ